MIYNPFSKLRFRRSWSNIPVITIDDFSSVTEGNNMILTLTKNGGLSKNTLVTYNLAGGATNPASADDLTNGFGNFTVTIPKGVRSYDINIPVNTDSENESNESVLATIVSVASGIVGEPSTFTAFINETPVTNDSTVTILSIGSVTEGTGGSPTSLPVVFQRTGNTSTTVVVDFTVTGGTVIPTDIQGGFADGQVTFTPGDTQKTYNIGIIQDNATEATETVLVTITSVSNGVPGIPSTGLGTIFDDDALPILKLASVANIGSEGTPAPGNDITVQVALSAALPVTSSVQYTFGKTTIDPIAADILGPVVDLKTISGIGTNYANYYNNFTNNIEQHQAQDVQNSFATSGPAAAFDDWIVPNYYDRARMYYAWSVALSVSDPTRSALYKTRADALALFYLEGYGTQGMGWPNPASVFGTIHNCMMPGLAIYSRLNPNDTVRKGRIENFFRVGGDFVNSTYYFNNVDESDRDNNGNGTYEGDCRQSGRILECLMYAIKLGITSASGNGDFRNSLRTYVSKILNFQSPEGPWKYFSAGTGTSLSAPRGQKCFMEAILIDQLINYYNWFADDTEKAAITASIKRSLDYMWSVNWLPASQAFKYREYSNASEPNTTGPAPDLNMLISNGFAWLFKTLGDTTYKTRYDAIVAGGMAGAWFTGFGNLGGSKIWNENFSSSYRGISYVNPSFDNMAAPAFTSNDLVGGTGPFTLTFAPGESLKTVVHKTAADYSFEPNEIFNVTLSNPTGTGLSLGTTRTRTGFITNDDAPVTTALLPTLPANGTYVAPGNGTTATASLLSLTQSVAEGSAGVSGKLRAIFSRTGNLSGPTNFQYSVGGGSVLGSASAAADDLTLGFGTYNATIPSLQSQVQIDIDVTPDSIIEPDETVAISLLSTGLTGATISTTPGDTVKYGTIVNDDFFPTVDIGSFTSATEGTTTQTGNLILVINRTGNLSDTSTVTYQLSGTTPNPIDASDLVGGFGPFTTTFAVGESSKTISIAIAPDTTFEQDETARVSILSAVRATLGTTLTANATITNDDASTAAINNQTIEFGALTFPSAGGARVYDNNGNEVNITALLSTVSIPSGKTASGWSLDANGRLIRTTETPATSDGVVFSVRTALSNTVINVTIATIPNCWSFSNVTEMGTIASQSMAAKDGKMAKARPGTYSLSSNWANINQSRYYTTGFTWSSHGTRDNTTFLLKEKYGDPTIAGDTPAVNVSFGAGRETWERIKFLVKSDYFYSAGTTKLKSPGVNFNSKEGMINTDFASNLTFRDCEITSDYESLQPGCSFYWMFNNASGGLGQVTGTNSFIGCKFSGFNRGFNTKDSATFIFRDNELSFFTLDGFAVGNPNFICENNFFHSVDADHETIGVARKMTKCASPLLNNKSSSKALIHFNGELSCNSLNSAGTNVTSPTARQILFGNAKNDFSVGRTGITNETVTINAYSSTDVSKPDSIEFVGKNSAGQTVLTMNSGQLPNYGRKNILFSIDTAGSSYMHIWITGGRVGRAPTKILVGPFTATIPGGLIDWTGTNSYVGSRWEGALNVRPTWMDGGCSIRRFSVWLDVNPNITQQPIRDNFYEDISGAIKQSVSNAYVSGLAGNIPLIDIAAPKDKWIFGRTPDRLGNPFVQITGFNFPTIANQTLASSMNDIYDVGHADVLQGIVNTSTTYWGDGNDISNFSIKNNVIYSGRLDGSEPKGGVQGFFLEDMRIWWTNNDTVVRNNLCIIAVNNAIVITHPRRSSVIHNTVTVLPEILSKADTGTYETGTATSGSTTTLTDTTKNWAVNQWNGKYIRITQVGGSYEELSALSNTATTITLNGTLLSPVTSTSTYRIIGNGSISGEIPNIVANLQNGINEGIILTVTGAPSGLPETVPTGTIKGGSYDGKQRWISKQGETTNRSGVSRYIRGTVPGNDTIYLSAPTGTTLYSNWTVGTVLQAITVTPTSGAIAVDTINPWTATIASITLSQPARENWDFTSIGNIVAGANAFGGGFAPIATTPNREVSNIELGASSTSIANLINVNSATFTGTGITDWRYSSSQLTSRAKIENAFRIKPSLQGTYDLKMGWDAYYNEVSPIDNNGNAFTTPSKLGVAINGLIESDFIIPTFASTPVNGAAVYAMTEDYSANVEVQLWNAAGTTLLRDWSTNAAVLQPGQRFKVRRRASNSNTGNTPVYTKIFVGRTEYTWEVRSKFPITIMDESFNSDPGGWAGSVWTSTGASTGEMRFNVTGRSTNNNCVLTAGKTYRILITMSRYGTGTGSRDVCVGLNNTAGGTAATAQIYGRGVGWAQRLPGNAQEGYSSTNPIVNPVPIPDFVVPSLSSFLSAPPNPSLTATTTPIYFWCNHRGNNAAITGLAFNRIQVIQLD